MLANDGPRHLEIHRGQPRWTLVGLAGKDKAKATNARKAKLKAKRARTTRVRRTEKERTSLLTRMLVRRPTRTRKKCFWCGRKGHMQADCYFKKEYEKNKGGVNMMNDSNGDGDTTAVDRVVAIVGERAERPFIDSGAVCSTCPPSFAPLAALENVTGKDRGGRRTDTIWRGCEARSEVGIRKVNTSPHKVSCSERAETHHQFERSSERRERRLLLKKHQWDCAS